MTVILSRMTGVSYIIPLSPLHYVASLVRTFASQSTGNDVSSLSSSSSSSTVTSKSPPHVPSLPYVYNSLTQGYQPYLPSHSNTSSPVPSNTITWYTCGPTVYDSAHLGHARTYLIMDILQRITETYIYPNRSLVSVMNITDIDDKIIQRASTLNTTPQDIALKYEEEFWDDMKALRVRKPVATPRVTEHIPDILEYIRVIVENKLAYVTDDGVYLDTTALGSLYGKMAPPSSTTTNTLDTEESPLSLPNPSTSVRKKRNPKDFALWKRTLSETSSSSSVNTIHWESPWGKGRPGWHIECTSMIHALFGTSKMFSSSLDIHAGGIDLAFPHHCNECAQADAYHNLPIKRLSSTDIKMAYPSMGVQHWLHSGHMYIQGSKMSKSLKNFITIRDFLRNQSSGLPINLPTDVSIEDAYRMYIFQYHYRSNITFTPLVIQENGIMIKRIKNILDNVMARLENNAKVRSSSSSPPPPPGSEGLSLSRTMNPRWRNEEFTFMRTITTIHQQLMIAYQQDFDTPQAVKLLNDLSTVFIQYVSANTTIHYDILVWGLSNYLQYFVTIGFDFPNVYMDRLTYLTKGSSSLSSSTSSSVLRTDTGGGGGIHEPSLRALVKFREKIRTESMGLSKELKQLTKIAKSSSEETSPKNRSIGKTSPNLSGSNVQDNEEVNLSLSIGKIRDQVKKVLESCDEVRDKIIPALGYELKDSPHGSVVSKK